MVSPRLNPRSGGGGRRSAGVSRWRRSGAARSSLRRFFFFFQSRGGAVLASWAVVSVGRGGVGRCRGEQATDANYLLLIFIPFSFGHFDFLRNISQSLTQ